MNLDLVLSPRRLIVAATPLDVEKLRAVRPGDLLPVIAHKPRNGDHHRKLFALLRFVSENHPGIVDESTGALVPWTGEEAVATWLKIRTHHYRGMQVYKGCVYMDLRSISYRELDEVEFSAWAARAKEIIFSELFPGLRNRERILAAIDEWTAWT